jgi:general secretion pathway protein A
MNETFYGGFYGFESAPFHVTPDPTLLFPTETHRAALGAIEYGIAAGKGFIAVTGEVGVGKTTVLRVCLDGLDSSKFKIIYLFSPALSTAELYATILEEFDVTLPPTSNAADLLRVLQRTLLAVHGSGMQVVLAVDEAQQMPEATLESLRILSNLETDKSKLLQIILVGQPELDAVLAKHSMRQLAQRIAVRARVKSLTFRQSCRYILHRTRCAGRLASRPLFTTPALLYLAFVAGGIPRAINICCDNALINGYGHAAERISLSIVREACKAMKFRSPLRRVAAVVAALILLVGLVAAGNALLRHSSSARVEPVPAVTQALPPLSDPAPTTAVTAPAKPGAQETTPQDRSPADSDAGNAPIAATADSADGSASGKDATAVAKAGAASPPEAAATPGGATGPSTSPTAGQNGAQKPSSAADTPVPTVPAKSSEPPAALRLAPTNSPAAAPLPWIASDDTSTREANQANRTNQASQASQTNQTGQAGQAQARRMSQTRATPRGSSKWVFWVVRDGDTVFKACAATYGSCDDRALREVLAENPKLGRDATIHPGEILTLRKRPPSPN